MPKDPAVDPNKFYKEYQLRGRVKTLDGKAWDYLTLVGEDLRALIGDRTIFNMALLLDDSWEKKTTIEKALHEATRGINHAYFAFHSVHEDLVLIGGDPGVERYPRRLGAFKSMHSYEEDIRRKHRSPDFYYYIEPIPRRRSTSILDHAIAFFESGGSIDTNESRTEILHDLSSLRGYMA